MRMWIYKKPGRPLATEASYHASELEGRPPVGMGLISVVENNDPIRCTEMVDEAIDRDIEFSLMALSINTGAPLAVDLGDFDVEVEVVRKEGG